MIPSVSVLTISRFAVITRSRGVVLGFMVESNYRRALVLSGGDHMTFMQDRISAVLLVLAFVFVAGSLVRHGLDARRRAEPSL